MSQHRDRDRTHGLLHTSRDWSRPRCLYPACGTRPRLGDIRLVVAPLPAAWAIGSQPTISVHVPGEQATIAVDDA
jgi:hypothetical protein